MEATRCFQFIGYTEAEKVPCWGDSFYIAAALQLLPKGIKLGPQLSDKYMRDDGTTEPALLQEILLMPEPIQVYGSPAGAYLQQLERGLAARLFAPFPAQLVKATCDTGLLSAMLKAPPATAIADPHNLLAQQPAFQQLFQHATSPPTPLLFLRLCRAALSKPAEPSQDPAAIQAASHDHWDRICSCMLEAAELAGIHVSTNTAVARQTSTAQSNRRWFHNNLVILHGEQGWVSKEGAAAMAQQHTGAAQVLYGQLQYVLGYSTEGAQITFYVLPLNQPRACTALIGPYNTNEPQGMVDAMIAFINVLRWINTAITSNWLPQASLPAPMCEEFSQPDTPTCSMVRTAIHGHHVTKSFHTNAWHLARMLPLYVKLQNRQVPHAVHPTSIKVYDSPVTIVNLKQVQQRLQGEFPDLGLLVELQSQPVGLVQMSFTLQEAYILLCALLELFKALHPRWCHRDVQTSNIIYLGANQYALAGWELAAPAGSPVLWRDDRMAVALNEPYYLHHDLWQAAALVRDYVELENETANAFLDRLQDARTYGLTPARALQELRRQQGAWMQ